MIRKNLKIGNIIISILVSLSFSKVAEAQNQQYHFLINGPSGTVCDIYRGTDASGVLLGHIDYYGGPEDHSFTYVTPTRLSSIYIDVISTYVPDEVYDMTYNLPSDQVTYHPFIHFEITWTPTFDLDAFTGATAPVDPLTVYTSAQTGLTALNFEKDDPDKNIHLILNTPYTGQVDWFVRVVGGSNYLFKSGGKTISTSYAGMMANSSFRNMYGQKLIIYPRVTINYYTGSSTYLYPYYVRPINYMTHMEINGGAGYGLDPEETVCGNMFWCRAELDQSSPYLSMDIYAQYTDQPSDNIGQMVKLVNAAYYYNESTVESADIRAAGLDPTKPLYFRGTRNGSVIPVTTKQGPVVIIDPPPMPTITEKGSCIGQNNGKVILDFPGITEGISYIVNMINRDAFIIDSDHPHVEFINLPDNCENIDTLKLSYQDTINDVTCNYNNIPYTIKTLSRPESPGFTLDQWPSCDNNDAVIFLESEVVGPDAHSIDSFYLYEVGGTIPICITNHTGILDCNLGPGTYEGIAVDDLGCRSSRNTNNIIIPQYVTLSLDHSNLQNPQCNDSTDGSVTLVPSGGVAGHTPTWQFYNITLNRPESVKVTGLGDGSYTFRLTDSAHSNCTTTDIVIMDEPDSVELTAYALSKGGSPWHISCFEGSDGEISVSARNYQGGAHFFINDIEYYPTSDIISGLDEGPHHVYVRDDSLCLSVVDTITLDAPAEISVALDSVRHQSCTELEDGYLEISGISQVGSCSYAWSDPSFQPVNYQDDLQAGTYNVTVYDDLCVTGVSRTYQINLLPQLTATISTVPPTCKGGHDAKIYIDVLSNTIGSTFYYSLNGGSQSQIRPLPDSITGLSPSVPYTLEIYDSRGTMCSNEQLITIPDQQSVELALTSISDPLCFGGTGSISIINVNGPGNPGNYTYAWYDSFSNLVSNNRNLIGVNSGNYRVNVSYNQSCDPEVFEDLVIEDPPQLIIDSLHIEDASCAEIANGSVTIYPSGGTETNNYEFSDGGSFIFNQPTFENLAPGTTYEFSVMDDNGCITSAETTLSAGEVTLALDDTSMVTCYGDDDGSISVIASGGSNYMYHISGPEINTNSTLPLFNNLGAGAYRLHVSDTSTKCGSEEMMINISEPDPLIITTLLIDSSACDKDLGHISFTVDGGNGGNHIIWTDSEDNVIENIVLDALHAGTYTVSIEDRKGCLEENIVTVPERPGPDITEHEIVIDTWCNKPLGKVELIVEEGSPEFHYNWSHQSGLDNAVADSLRAGTYQITVTDLYLCQDIYEFVLEDGPALSPLADITDAHCNMNDGLAELIVSGGISPYSYVWPDSVSAVPVTNPVMTDLYAGEYEVTITDEIGCDTSFFVNISNINGPESAPVSITSSWCGLPTGTAQMSVTGGDLPYSYSWRPDNNSTILSTTLSADGLTAGEYLFQVTDGIGCIDYYKIIVEDSAELEPNLRFISMDSAACGNPTGALTVAMDSGLAPYHYQWNTAADDTLGILSGVTAGTYQVTATDERGCVKSLEMAVADRHLPVIRFHSMQNAYCGSPTGQFVVTLHHGREPFVAYLQDSPDVTYPFTLSDSSSGTYIAVLGNLTASENLYTVQASDADGCESNTVSNYIDEDNPMQLTLLSVQPVSCYGGSDGSAAIAVEDGVEPYTFVWSENSVNNAVNNNLTGGTFSVTVTDAMECTRISSGFSVPEPSQVRITRSTVTQPGCFGLCDGSITPYASGGTGALIYVWNNSDTVRTITGLCAGEADLRVIDANNCPAETSVTVTEPPLETIAGMPDEAEVCEGQVFILDPGEGYTSCVWTSTNGFTSDEHTANITQGGTYFLSALSPGGCAVSDTFRLIVSDNLLEAEFLMASEGYVGDTIVIIEVSWPYADVCSWTLPEEADVITDLDYYKELIFRNSGTFYVEMNARLATCVAMKGKYIDIYSTVPGKDSEIPVEENVISSLNIFPNPAQEYLTLNVKLAQEEDIRVEMLGVSGNKVSDSVVGYGLSEYEVNLDVSSLMPGVYLLRLIAGGQVETRMLVVH